MTKLQNAFASKILEHAPVHREKFEKMQELQRKAFAGENVDERALLAAVEIASELLPILHFKVDDVCWDV